jgi:polysaccharide biosynthesis/export protein
VSHPFNQRQSALAWTLLHCLWEGAAVALVGGLVVTFTQFAPEGPVSARMWWIVTLWFAGVLIFFVRRVEVRAEQRFASAMPLVTAAALTLCVSTMMMGWQAQVASEPDAVPAPAPAAPAVSLPDHKVLPNDLLSITVYDEPELSRSARVDADGKIAMPQLTAKLQASGLMPRDIEKEVSIALVDGQILLHPIVTVAILEYAERSISVVGDVRLPGQFKVTSPISLLEALAKAGWITEDAGPDVLLTTPDSPTPRKINLRDLQMSTDRSLNVMLTGGEIVSVPDAMKELATRFPEGPKIWVTGNVGHPLVYSITKPADATVLKVIASAGGLLQNNTKTAWIYRLDGAGNRNEIHIPLSDIVHSKAPDVTLQADDVLLVPDSDTKKMQEYYDTHPLTPPWEKAK